MEPRSTPTGWETVKSRPGVVGAVVLATVGVSLALLVGPWSRGPIPQQAQAAVASACAEMQRAITQARAHDRDASRTRMRNAVRHFERAAALDDRYDYLLRAARTVQKVDVSTPAARQKTTEAVVVLAERCGAE